MSLMSLEGAKTESKIAKISFAALKVPYYI